MSEKRVVSGLLDYVVAVHSGEPFTFRLPSPNYVLGMGVGASEQATKWAYKGLQHELEEKLALATKKSAGRPSKEGALKASQLRTFHLWLIASEYTESQRQELQVNQLIKIVKNIDFLTGKTKHLWNVGSFESLAQSISRGRKWWQIDKAWNSPKCDAFWQSIKPL